MTRKHAELEKELIDDLLPRTGRSLGQWMAEIDAAGLSGKNEIIDWLRPRGFTFANASWLERIHNNGGRPIYLDGGAVSGPGAPPQPSSAAAKPAALPQSARQPRPAAEPLAASPAVRPVPGSLADVLARGKAFRPLAEMVVRQIEAALPGVIVGADGDLVAFGRPRELAVLHVSPRELRLGLALGDQEIADGLVKARIPGAAPHVTQMIVLTDARQVGPALIERVLAADRIANPS